MSAVKGQGLMELIEAIALAAELADLKTPTPCIGEAVVLESRVDPKKGSTVSLIVRQGIAALVRLVT